jgi:hypothetical protein
MTAGKAAVREQGRSARLPGQGHRDLLSARCPPALPGHRMRNLAAKVPEDVWPEFKGRVQAAHQAPSRAIARELAAGVVADYGREQERGVACFMDDSNPASPTCASRSRIGERSAPPTCSSGFRGGAAMPQDHSQYLR